MGQVYAEARSLRRLCDCLSIALQFSSVGGMLLAVSLVLPLPGVERAVAQVVAAGALTSPWSLVGTAVAGIRWREVEE